MTPRSYLLTAPALLGWLLVSSGALGQITAVRPTSPQPREPNAPAASSTAASSTAASTTSAGSTAGSATEARPFRLELDGHGAWLPFGGARAGVGAGLGVGYRFLSIGPELWRYHLTLEDSLTGQRRAYPVTVLVPLRVGISFNVGSLPWRVGAAAGFGLDTSSEALRISTTANRLYGPFVLLTRAFASAPIGPLRIGPHLGFAYDVSGASDEGDGMPDPVPDPYRKHYPIRLPFGWQLGLSVSAEYP